MEESVAWGTATSYCSGLLLFDKLLTQGCAS